MLIWELEVCVLILELFQLETWFGPIIFFSASNPLIVLMGAIIFLFISVYLEE